MNTATPSFKLALRMRTACVVLGAFSLIGAAAAHADLLSVGKTSSGGLSVKVSAGVARAGVSLGGGSVASLGADVAGLDAKASVGGNSVASACVGSCNTSSILGVSPGTPTAPSMTPVVGQPASPAKIVAPAILTCATKAGNTTAFNGYKLHDRDGRMLGIVHSAELDGKVKIKSISIQNVQKRCTSISDTSFVVTNSGITGAFDARRSGLAFRN